MEGGEGGLAVKARPPWRMLPDRQGRCISTTSLFPKLLAPRGHLQAAQRGSAEGYKQLATRSLTPGPQQSRDSRLIPSKLCCPKTCSCGLGGAGQKVASRVSHLLPPQTDPITAWLLAPKRTQSALSLPESALALWGARSQQGHTPHPTRAICTQLQAFGSSRGLFSCCWFSVIS